MADALYTKFKEKLLDGSGIDLVNDDIRAILVDINDYTLNIDTHDFLDDIPAAARVAVSAAMTGKVVTDGVFDANDVTWTAVTGDESEAVVLYKHTGVEGTSPLIIFLDQPTGLPVLPNGGNISIQWDDGANRIFKL
jgi:hypothetical protein